MWAGLPPSSHTWRKGWCGAGRQPSPYNKFHLPPRFRRTGLAHAPFESKGVAIIMEYKYLSAGLRPSVWAEEQMEPLSEISCIQLMNLRPSPMADGLLAWIWEKTNRT